MVKNSQKLYRFLTWGWEGWTWLDWVWLSWTWQTCQTDRTAQRNRSAKGKNFARQFLIGCS